jgi:Phage tail assembly chaperone protein, TAC
MRTRVESITGRAVAEIGGELRVLACDMGAAQELYAAHGEHWTYWLAERCGGRISSPMDGFSVRVVDPMSNDELGSLLVALLAGDRRRNNRIDTVQSVLDAIGSDGLMDAQRLATLVVVPCFDIPGKGLTKERRRRPRKKKESWDWKRVLEIALGLLRLTPETFWSLTLVEWHTLMSGYAERERGEMRKIAWASRNQLISAGAKPEDVSVAKLLGEKELRRRAVKPKKELSLNEVYERMQRVDANGKPMPKDQVIDGNA